MLFELGVDNIDNWYINLDITSEFTIKTLPNVKNPLRIYIF